MELGIIKSLMDSDFYSQYKHNCPDKLFSKDTIKIKQAVDVAMEKYKRSITVEEVESLFMISNPGMTTAKREIYKSCFDKIRAVDIFGKDIAGDILAKMFQQYLGEEIANIGFDYVNGEGTSLLPLRELIDKYNDNFLPSTEIEWEDLSLDNLIRLNKEEYKWKFNLPTLASRIQGINSGHFVILGARPNTGKTSFHASMIAGPGGFAEQGAKCMILLNEEGWSRVGMRYVTTALGIHKDKVTSQSMNHEKWVKVHENLMIKYWANRDMNNVEIAIKAYKPNIVVMDIGDKFATSNNGTAQHEALKSCAIRARMIASEYECAIIYTSQLSAEAEDKVVVNQSMLEGSKTGKAGEADLMILLSKNPTLDTTSIEDNVRYITIAKNKLNGYHGMDQCMIDPVSGRYRA